MKEHNTVGNNEENYTDKISDNPNNPIEQNLSYLVVSTQQTPE